jgi:hypothetical protein
MTTMQTILLIAVLLSLWYINDRRRASMPPRPPQQPLTFWDGVARLVGGFIVGVILFFVLVLVGGELAKQHVF